MVIDGQIKTPQEANIAMVDIKDEIHKVEKDAKDFAMEGWKRMNDDQKMLATSEADGCC